MSVFHNNALLGSAQPSGVRFDTTLIPNSIFFDGSGTSGDSMTRTSTTPDNRNRWLFGTWYHPLRVPTGSSDRMVIFAVAASKPADGSGTAGFYLRHNEDGLGIFHRDEDETEGSITTNEEIRDVTTWYHIMVDYDSANANSQDRISLYLNGERVGTNNDNRPGQNKCVFVNTEGEIERIGMDGSTTPASAGEYYLAQTFLMDNKSLMNSDLEISDILDTFTFGTNGSQIIPKSNDDIKALVAAAGPNSFFLNYEDTTDKGSVDGMTRDRKATESTNHVAGITPTLTESIQGGATANVTNGQRSRGALETTTTTLTLLFDLGEGNEQAVQSVSFTTEGFTDFARDPGQGNSISQTNGRIKDLTISGSNNGTDFTTLSSSTVAQKRSNALHVVSWSNTTAYRYLKFANANIHGGLRSNVGGLGFHTEQSPVIGNDFWGDKNHSTSSGASEINQDHQSSHSPSNVYAVFNSATAASSSSPTFAEGNLRSTASGGSDGHVFSTVPLPTSGTSEFQVKSNAGIGRVGIIAYDGVVEISTSASNNAGAGTGEGSFDASYLYDHNGAFRKVTVAGGNETTSSFFDTYTTNDIITVRYNADANELNFLKNNVATGSTISTVSGLTYFATVGRGATGSGNYDYTAFFDASKFPHTIGTGNKEVNTANQTAPEYQGIDYFDATLYEGNGGSQRVGDFVPVTDVYTVSKSALWDDGDKRYLKFTPDSGGDEKTWTFSTWFKLTAGASFQRNAFLATGTSSGKQAQILHRGDQSTKDIKVAFYNGSSFVANLSTSREFFDETIWFNLVVAVDTRTGVSSDDKIKVYINGVQETLTGTTLSIDDYDTHINTAAEHNLGRQPENDFGHASFYLAETVMVEGQQLDPSSFGQLDTSTNRWIPKDVSGLTFGTEGWYLEYDGTGFGNGGNGETPSGGAGKDSSGNDNHWEEAHASGSDWVAGDQFADSPTENFAIIDPALGAGGTGGVLTNGNLSYRQSSTDGSHVHQYSSLTMESGKYYAEYAMITQATNRPQLSIGVIKDPDAETSTLASSINQQGFGGPITSGSYPNAPDGFGHGQFAANNDGVEGSTLSSLSLNNNIFGILLDLDNLNVKFSINGTINDNLTIDPIPKGKYRFASSTERGSGDGEHRILINFGQLIGGFEATSNFSASATSFDATTDAYWVDAPPAGYVALREDNLNATASKMVAWSWIKNRDQTDNHILIDRVRGVRKDLHTNTTDVEATNDNTVQRFLQRGVQIGDDVEVNTSREKYVLWQWLVGDTVGTTTIDASSTTPTNSLASTVAAADAGHFSVVGFTGSSGAARTIAHGMGGTPEMMIFINREQAGANRTVYHKRIGNTNYILLSSGAATPASGNINYFNNTDPDSTVFTVGSGATPDTNGNGQGMIVYCFRSVPGVCKVGSYTGNGSGSGTIEGHYVHTGFRPKWIMIKWQTGGSLSSEGFIVKDTTRQTFNENNDADIYASFNTQETAGSTHGIDFLSDGFKLRGGGGAVNKSGATYIYLAMAEIGGGGTLPPIYGI